MYCNTNVFYSLSRSLNILSISFLPMLCHSHLLTAVSSPPTFWFLKDFSGTSATNTLHLLLLASLTASWSSVRCCSIICSLLDEHNHMLAWSALVSSLNHVCKQSTVRSQLTAAALPVVVSGLNVSQNTKTGTHLKTDIYWHLGLFICQCGPPFIWRISLVVILLLR